MSNKKTIARKKRRLKARFRVIVKVACKQHCRDNDCKQCRWLKYRRVNNMERFETFLNRVFPLWRFMNVYCGINRDYLHSYTRKGKTYWKGLYLNQFYFEQ